jgi:hypothetical protein
MHFKNSISLFFIVLLFVGCADYAKVEVAKVESLMLKESSEEKINHGNAFKFEVLAVMKNGREENITRHPDLKIESEFLVQKEGNAFQLEARPLSFESTNYAVSLTIADASDTVQSTDHLELNYNGGLWIQSASLKGMNAQPQGKSGVTLFSPNGVEGKAGIDGENGQDGGNYTGYIWMENEELRFRMENDSTSIVWKYKSRKCDTIFIDLSGGVGGNGGAGGEGGDGKNGKVAKAPGNGGNGANGGNAGSGGNGGSILIFVHHNAEFIIPKINIIQYGGQAGQNGPGGLAGNPGKPIKDQKNGSLGEHGRNGIQGNMGKAGPGVVISIINFDFEALD